MDFHQARYTHIHWVSIEARFKIHPVFGQSLPKSQIYFIIKVAQTIVIIFRSEITPRIIMINNPEKPYDMV